MKKTIVMMLLIVGLGIVMTSSLAAGESIDVPGGKNLLNLRTVYDIDLNGYGNSRSYIVGVTLGETHTVVMDYDYADNCLGSLIEFEYEEYPSGYPGFATYIYDETNERIYAEFTPNENYINVFSVPVPKGPTVTSYNIMLYEGDYASFDGFEPYVADGFNYESSGSLSLDYDDLMTLAEIEALITAKDPDGNVIDKTIASDTFSSGDKTPGTYQIVFEAAYNQIIRRYLLDISVFDTTPPVISGPDALEYEISDRPDVSEINALYTVTDNVNVNVELVVTTNTYTNASSLGTYWIYYEATDSSGNTTEKQVPITLVDTTAPELRGPFDLYIYTTDTAYTEAEIIATYDSEDIVDGDCDVTISSNGYAGTTIAGIYEVVVASSDSLGNATSRTIYIHVIDNRGPEFVSDELVIDTDPAEVLSSGDVILAFTTHMAELNVKVENVEIQYNEYENNEQAEGSYYVYLSYDVDGQTETSRVLITVKDEGLSFSPYYLLGIVPVSGIVAFILIKKRSF